MNYGNDTYNPGYCGIFGIIAMVFWGYRPPTAELRSIDQGGSSPPNGGVGCGSEGGGCGGPVGGETSESESTKASEIWFQEWKQLLKYMRQDIPDEPESHGCMGTNLAARVQEIIAAHPSTVTGHQNAEEEILREITQALTQALSTKH